MLLLEFYTDKFEVPIGAVVGQAKVSIELATDGNSH
jgi:hypothetical protein